MIELIPLHKLNISPMNVRTVSPDDSDDKELIAGISAVGLLQNLVVHKEGKGYEVVAGGRRFAALTFLCGDPESAHITKDYPVPCLVADKGADIVELSLMENINRKAMHPADEFVAYQAMIDGGKSIDVIATHFHTEQSRVKKLLKLASVSPDLLDLYRKDKFGLDCMMAFTVCDDHEKQLAAYKEYANNYLNPHRIRQFLTSSAETSKSALARFVSTNAYKKAGGAVMSDLFEKTTYLTDKDLLLELATKKLQKRADELQEAGWKWVTIETYGPVYPHDYYRLDPEPVGVPKRLRTSIDNAQIEVDRFENLDWDSMDDDECEKQGQLESKAEKKLRDLEDKLDEYLTFSDAQREISGVIVSFDNQGKWAIHEGLVKKSDVKAARALEQGETNSSNGATSNSNSGSEDEGESAALVADLKTYRAQVARALIVAQPTIAIDVLHFSICDQIIRDVAHWETRRLVDVSITVDRTPVAADDLDSTRAGQEISAVYSGLNTSWCTLENGAERFTAFCGLKSKEKQALVAYAVGLSLKSYIFEDDNDSESKVLVDTLSPAFADYWRPTDTNYLKRIKRDRLLEIGTELVGGEWLEQHKGAKKGDLVSLLHSIFNDSEDTNRDDNNQSVIDGWLPTTMTV